MSKVMKIVLIVLLVIVLAVVGLGVYVLTSMRSDAVETVEKPVDLVMESTEAPEEVVSEEATPTPTAMPIFEEQSKVASVVNILLIGTDSRTAAEVQDAEGRSDSMMLASINTEKGTITLVSFLRDARVHRIGKSGRFTFFNRLNGAYSGGYGGGGPGELINTLNENFKLDIQEYVSIGFEGFAAMIDQIGGLDSSTSRTPSVRRPPSRKTRASSISTAHSASSMPVTATPALPADRATILTVSTASRRSSSSCLRR